jgi:hypothetical protein
VCSVILFSCSIWLDAAINITFVRLKHQCYSRYLQITTLLSLLSCGSALIAACCYYHCGEKRLVNSITFFHFVGIGSVVTAARQQRWQRWQRAIFSGSSSALGNVVFLVKSKNWVLSKIRVFVCLCIF